MKDREYWIDAVVTFAKDYADSEFAGDPWLDDELRERADKLIKHLKVLTISEILEGTTRELG